MAEKLFKPLPIILIVDDQMSDVRILVEAVDELAEVHVARDGQSALEKAQLFRPDLILLDIQMPGMNGFEFCRLIKADIKLCDAAILFVSAHTQSENEILALEYGGIDFIPKPLSIPVTQAHVKAHLTLRFEAKRLAYYDALTGLPNRMLLRDRAEQMLEKARHYSERVALMLLDIDNFHNFNETQGYSIGDVVLKNIANLLNDWSSTLGTVSRQGGDEFVMAIPDIKSLGALGEDVQALLEIISSPINIDSIRYDLSACIGISIFPDDGEDLESLYSHANSAVHQAKKEGRSLYRFFSKDIEEDARKRHVMESRIRSALEFDGFEVFYQVKFNAKSHQPAGMEALVRLRSAEGELIPPADFIPLAEETGLIIPIGKKVLHQACIDANTLLDHDVSMCVGVNISVMQFREGSLLNTIKEVLDHTGLPNNLLELEVTEGVLATDMDKARAVLTELKHIGVRIALDDFGTGYSSLSIMKTLPIDVLKIDQSFVREMLTDKRNTSIIEAIVLMGQALDLELVAEGVETSEQLEKLLDLGCELMQGYYYCKPMPFEQLCKFLDMASLFGEPAQGENS